MFQNMHCQGKGKNADFEMLKQLFVQKSAQKKLLIKEPGLNFKCTCFPEHILKII